MHSRTATAIAGSVAWLAVCAWFFGAHQISPNDPLASLGSFLQGAGTPVAVLWAIMAYWQVSEQILLTKRAQDAQDATQAEQQRLNSETIAAFRRYADVAKEQLDLQRAAEAPHIVHVPSAGDAGQLGRLIPFRNHGGRAFGVKAQCVYAGARCVSPAPQVIDPDQVFNIRIIADAIETWDRPIDVRFTYTVVDGREQEQVVAIRPAR